VASLAEIARLAGVSHMTVSRVLSGRQKGVRSDANDRADDIRRIAAELGYRPTHAARSLRSGRTGIVALLGGVIMSVDAANTEDLEAVRTLSSILSSDHGLNLAAQLEPRSSGGFTLPPWGIDAAVIYSPCSAEDCASAEAARVPYVTMNGPSGPNGAAVVLDDDRGMKMAMEHLLGLGHRAICYLGYEATAFDHPSTSVRRRAYLREMGARGLATPPGFDWSLEDWRGRMPEVVAELTKAHGVTAIVTHSHWQAYQVYDAAGRLGLSIPDDLSVVTFNDTWAGMDLMRPALTAVARPAEAMARAVASLLVRRLAKGEWPSRVQVVHEELRVRGSTAPPRAAATTTS
jgi:LacI family transcriptional regulator